MTNSLIWKQETTLQNDRFKLKIMLMIESEKCPFNTSGHFSRILTSATRLRDSGLFGNYLFGNEVLTQKWTTAVFDKQKLEPSGSINKREIYLQQVQRQ